MKIVLGTAQFGQKYGVTNKKRISFNQIKKIEKKIFYQKKIHYIDTAFDYKNAHKIISKTKLSNLNTGTFCIALHVNTLEHIISPSSNAMLSKSSNAKLLLFLINWS